MVNSKVISKGFSDGFDKEIIQKKIECVESV
jgi:hypothetical protein